MSSILDALHKKRDDKPVLRPLDEPQGRRRMASRGSGPSVKKVLGVGVVIAVCALGGFALYRSVGRLGMVTIHFGSSSADQGALQEPGGRSEAGIVIGPGGLPTPKTIREQLVPIVPLNQVEQKPHGEEVKQPVVPPAAETPLAESSVPQRSESPPSLQATIEEDESTPAEFSDSKEKPVLYLNGIMYNEKQPMAIVNGRLVGIGDSVEGRRVEAVYRDGVRIEGFEQLLKME